uniref:Protein-tyrosine sulfotransferase n=1 Tax=Rhabditophanes sp. KR3021 TaxID=114890 RepID=A0AC35TIY7_9BILA
MFKSRCFLIFFILSFSILLGWLILVPNVDTNHGLWNEKVIFVGGCPRSGTTLMRALLDAHDDVRCHGETRVIPYLLSILTFWERKDHKEMLDDAGVTRDVLNKAVRSFISEIIVNHGDKAPIYCNKDPLNLSHANRLHEMFPKSKFILMIRDGRATVHSIMSREVPVSGFSFTNQTKSLMAWNLLIDNMVLECKSIGAENCLMVHYEKLVTHPQEELERIVSFLQIPFQNQLLHHEELIGKDVKLIEGEWSTDQVKEKINSDALNKWKDFYDPDVIKNIDKLAPMLRNLGYL